MTKHREEPSTADVTGQPTARARYVAPALTVYGSVSQLTLGAGGSIADTVSGSGLGMMMSERHLKEGVVRVGEHPLGFGIYLFSYKPAYRDVWGHGRQLGAMVDEVEAVMPAAVSMHPDGYKLVNYAMLGIRPLN